MEKFVENGDYAVTKPVKVYSVEDSSKVQRLAFPVIFTAILILNGIRWLVALLAG